MSVHGVDILLVEDDPDHVELILKVLGEDQALDAVHVARDGEEALDFLYRRGEYADAPEPGLILLDIKLPRVGGIEVLRRIKSEEQLKFIPVVMLTTSGGEEEMTVSYRYGANSYIVKPMGFEQFVKTVKQVRLYWLVTNCVPS